MIDLYYAPDNASLIVRIVLEELGIAYRAIPVNRTNREQDSDSYLALNPNGLIPVCIIDRQPVFETAAIALTLADNAVDFGARRNGLYTPAVNTRTRSQFLKWLFFVSSTLHSDLRLLFYPEQYVGDDVERKKLFSLLTRERLYRSCAILNVEYSRSGHQFLFADGLCIVDITLAVCLRWVQLYPVNADARIELGEFCALKSMVVDLQSRPMVKAACESEGITEDCFTAPGFPG